jgi:hypothetical protein
MRLLLGVCALGVVLAPNAQATTHLVDPSGLGQYPNIQAAITAAAEDDTVALLAGLYVGEGNRDITFLGSRLVVRKMGVLSPALSRPETRTFTVNLLPESTEGPGASPMESRFEGIITAEARSLWRRCAPVHPKAS